MPRKATPGTRPKGSGPGWGGPAKGAGSNAALPPFTSDHQPAPGAVEAGKMDKAARVAAHIDRLERIADAAEKAERFNEATTATNAALDRLVGKPVQTNVNLDRDDIAALSDAELHAELARLGGAIAEGSPRDAPPRLSDGPADVVH